MQQQPSRQLGIKEKWAHTKAKWSPHAPDVIAVGSAENFGIAGRGMTQVKKI